MAKQLGVVQFRGRLGQTVGARRAPGQKSNIIRVRPEVVNNPNTNAQILRRMRVKPAQNFYTALKEILNHSFQGVKYGGASYNYFMKQALLQDLFPYVKKGDWRPYPFPYLISKGSLQSVEQMIVTFPPGITFGLTLSSGTIEDNILGRILDSYPFLREGDQLTFVTCEMDDGVLADPQISWRVRRLILSRGGVVNWLFTDLDVEGGAVAFVGDLTTVVAGAVIVSRPNISKTSNTVTWERSNEVLLVAGDVLQPLTSNTQLEAAIASYQKQTTDPTSDWYLNGGSTEESGPTPESSTKTITVHNDRGGGTVTGAGSYEVGSICTLRATPAQGYTFGGWSYGENAPIVSRENPYEFVVASNFEIWANWTVVE